MKSPLLLLGLVGAAAFAFAKSAGAAKHPAPSVTGLAANGAYRLIVRSTFGQGTFDLNAAMQQIQALLGREGFDVKLVAPNENGDPYVYDVLGFYRSGDGTLWDVPGVIMLGSSPIDPTTIPSVSDPSDPSIGPTFIEARPVPVSPGVVYFGRASIPWPASMVVSKSMVASKLAEKGFANVTVYDDASQLPAAWPVTERGGDIFASGVWTGPATSLDLPSQVLSVWTFQ